MNTLYLPIIGEYSLEKKMFSLCILSLADQDINVQLRNYNTQQTLQQENLTMNVNMIYSLKFENIECLEYMLYIGDYPIKMDISRNIDKHVTILNCDCQFVPETNTIKKVNTETFNLSFHLGDQIYLDLVFLDLFHYIDLNIHLLHSKILDSYVRSKILKEYVVTFRRKLNVLQHSFNVFLSDDHEICDESVLAKCLKLNPDIAKYLYSIFKSINTTIQTCMRVTDSNMITYNNSSFLLVDNIDTLSYIDYDDKLRSILNSSVKFTEHLYILSPRVLLNIKVLNFNRIMFKTQPSDVNYETLYETLFSLPCEKITIFCGDVHSSNKCSIIDNASSKEIGLMLVGPINSVLNKPNKFYIKSNKFSYYQYYSCHNKHSFIEMINHNPKHVFKKSYKNLLFGGMAYLSQALYYDKIKPKFRLKSYVN